MVDVDWRVKGVVQKVLSGLPGGVIVNNSLQRHLGELRNPDRHLDNKVAGDWVTLMGYLRRAGISVTGLDIVEIGTGWHPALPICFSLAGAHRCRTYDNVRHLDADLTLRMLERVGAHLDAIAQAAGRHPDQVRRDYLALREAATVEELLDRARITYVAPADAAATGLADGSVDLVYSNSVLEHVRSSLLPGLITETARVLRPGGFAAHCVACNDHYAHFDRGISYVNFLRYGRARWGLWNNDLNHQNRLRKSDYLRTLTDAGFEVVQVNTDVRPGVREALASMRVAAPFRGYPADDLETTSVDVIARRP